MIPPYETEIFFSLQQSDGTTIKRLQLLTITIG